MTDKPQCVGRDQEKDIFLEDKKTHDHLDHQDHVLLNIKDMDNNILNSVLETHDLAHVAGDKIL